MVNKMVNGPIQIEPSGSCFYDSLKQG